MFHRDSSVHVRSYRLALLGQRRTFLRELRGDYVKRSQLASLLTLWANEWYELIEQARELVGMARDKNGSSGLAWKGFKDFKLNPEQLEAFAHFEAHDDDLMDLVQSSLGADYKLTFTYNGQSDTYNAAMTCNADKDVNQGYTMSAFAPSMYTALRLLMFKHWVLLEGNWGNIPAPQKGGMG